MVARIIATALAWLMAFAAGYLLGGLIVNVALGAEPDKPLFKLEFVCPTGEHVQSVTSDPDIVVIYVMAVTGKIGVEQFKAVMTSKFPDRKHDIKEFMSKCLGADSGA